MVQALLNGIIYLLMKIIGLAGSIVIYPLQLLIVSIFPDFGQFSSEALNWIITNVFPLICFIKHLFLTVTGFPEALWSILVAELAIWLTLAVSVRTLMLVYRLYLFIRGSEI